MQSFHGIRQSYCGFLDVNLKDMRQLMKKLRPYICATGRGKPKWECICIVQLSLSFCCSGFNPMVGCYCQSSMRRCFALVMPFSSLKSFLLRMLSWRPTHRAPPQGLDHLCLITSPGLRKLSSKSIFRYMNFSRSNQSVLVSDR
jgi:hypothetical protein